MNAWNTQLSRSQMKSSDTLMHSIRTFICTLTYREFVLFCDFANVLIFEPHSNAIVIACWTNVFILIIVLFMFMFLFQCALKCVWMGFPRTSNLFSQDTYTHHIIMRCMCTCTEWTHERIRRNVCLYMSHILGIKANSVNTTNGLKLSGSLPYDDASFISILKFKFSFFRWTCNGRWINWVTKKLPDMMQQIKWMNQQTMWASEVCTAAFAVSCGKHGEFSLRAEQFVSSNAETKGFYQFKKHSCDNIYQGWTLY